MQQTFEYWKVDPLTWGDAELIENVKSSSISWDISATTLGSASFDIDNTVGECYIRTYLKVKQGDETDRIVLGTHLAQTPSIKFDGKVMSTSLDAYTPLIELKDNKPPLGYTILKGNKILDYVSDLVLENSRAPITAASSDDTVLNESLIGNFVASTDDTWLTFLTDLLAQAEYSFRLEPDGHILLMPDQDFESLQPVYTFNDDNSSILYSDVEIKRDLYGIPNVLEVSYTYSGDSKSQYLYSKVVNDSESSPVSTVNRGREIVYRESSPNFSGSITQAQLDAYAKQLLKNLSCLEYTVTFSHGYVPNVRIGDCVRLNYTRAGLSNVRARITEQQIDCSTGCKVSETATYTESLWSDTTTEENIEPSYSLNLNDGQWRKPYIGSTRYQSNAGSYGISNGKSVATITLQGYRQFVIYIEKCSSVPSGWYMETFALDTTAKRGTGIYSTKGQQGKNGWLRCVYNISDSNEHSIDIMYSKDQYFPLSGYEPRLEFYIGIDECN